MPGRKEKEATDQTKLNFEHAHKIGVIKLDIYNLLKRRALVNIHQFQLKIIIQCYLRVRTNKK